MADRKPSGFRFRFPWLQQAPTPTPAPEPSTQSPRTTPQTSAQRPPFRPATPAPTSPRRSPPQSVPKSPISETIEPVATKPSKENQTTTKTVQATETTPAKETQTTTETIPPIETLGPTTTPQTPPRQAQSQQPSPPQSPLQVRVSSPPVSPTRIPTLPQTNSQPRSPSRLATPTKPSSLSFAEASPPRETSQPSSPTQTPPKFPPKTSSSSSSTPEIKRLTEITKVKGTQTKSHSTETKSQKPKPISTSTRVALPREIKDDISKFIHKITTTSTSKQSSNEQPASIITIAGNNKGAFMHLNSDAVKRDIKQDSKLGENEETEAIVNSNVQGINNSMMFNSSVTERNPGVHLVITRNVPTNMNDTSMKNAESMEMQRAEFNISPPQKVIYDPTIGISIQDDYEPDDF